jgi:hypothetical protein
MEDHTRKIIIAANKTLTLALSLKGRGKNSFRDRGGEKLSPSPLRGEGRGEELIFGVEPQERIISPVFR